MNIQLIHIATFQKYYLLNGASFGTNYINCHLFMGKISNDSSLYFRITRSINFEVGGGGEQKLPYQFQFEQ